MARVRIDKAFDPQEKRDDAGKWSASGAGGKKHPPLTDDQRDALRALAEHFPDGIAHLLTKSGHVDREHIHPGAAAAEKRIAELRSQHDAIDTKIAALLKDAAKSQTLAESDDALNDEVNNGIDGNTNVDTSAFDADADPDLYAAIDAVSGAVTAVTDGPLPEHETAPDESDYDGSDDLPAEDDDPDTYEDQVAELESAVAAHTDRLADLKGTVADYAKSVAAESAKWRAETRANLESLHAAAVAVLKIPAERYYAADVGYDPDDPDGYDPTAMENERAGLMTLRDNAAELLDSFAPPKPGRQSKAFDPAAAHDPELHADPHQALLLAHIDHLIRCQESGEDCAPGEKELFRLWDDPESLSEILADAHESDDARPAVEKAHTLAYLKAWTAAQKDLHPRDKAGKFIDKDQIHAAKSNPALAARLRAQVRPADAGKLNDAIAGKTDLGRTAKGVAREASQSKKDARIATRAKVAKLALDILTGSDANAPREGTVHQYRELAAALAGDHLTVNDLRGLRLKLSASFGGGRRKEEMVKALTAHVTGAYEDTITAETRRAMAAEAKRNVSRKTRGGAESVLNQVIAMGGIDPHSLDLKGTYGKMKDALNDGIPLAVFRTGGGGLDAIAHELESDGYITTPNGMHPGEHVLNLLREKAKHKYADTTKEVEDAYQAYYAARADAEREHNVAEVAGAVRSGSAAGGGDGGAAKVGEHAGGADADPWDAAGNLSKPFDELTGEQLEKWMSLTPPGGDDVRAEESTGAAASGEPEPWDDPPDTAPDEPETYTPPSDASAVATEAQSIYSRLPRRAPDDGGPPIPGPEKVAALLGRAQAISKPLADGLSSFLGGGRRYSYRMYHVAREMVDKHERESAKAAPDTASAPNVPPSASAVEPAPDAPAHPTPLHALAAHAGNIAALHAEAAKLRDAANQPNGSLAFHDAMTAALRGEHGPAVKAAVSRALDDWSGYQGDTAKKYARVAEEVAKIAGEQGKAADTAPVDASAPNVPPPAAASPAQPVSLFSGARQRAIRDGAKNDAEDAGIDPTKSVPDRLDGARITSREALTAPQPAPADADTAALDAAEGHAARMRDWEGDRPGVKPAQDARDRAEARVVAERAKLEPATGKAPPSQIGSRAEYEAGLNKPKDAAPFASLPAAAIPAAVAGEAAKQSPIASQSSPNASNSPPIAAKKPHEMTADERKAEIARIKVDEREALATPNPAEGNISPFQIGQMSPRQHKKFMANLSKKIDAERRMKELGKTDVELTAGVDAGKRRETEGRATQIARQLQDINNIAGDYKPGKPNMVVGANGKMKPKYQRTMDAARSELAALAALHPSIAEKHAAHLPPAAGEAAPAPNGKKPRAITKPEATPAETSKPATPSADPVTQPTTAPAAAVEAAQKAGDTPRQVADAATKASADDYAFARPSAVGNVGEDLKGSARHKRNEWRSLADAEKNGTAAALVTRDNLLKNEPHDLTATIEPHTSLQHLAAHLALNAFPSEPGNYPAAYDKYRSRSGAALQPATPPEQLRKQYHDAYHAIKGAAEKAATTAKDPREVLSAIAKVAKQHINIARGLPPDASGMIATAGAPDPYNPVANGLIDIHNRAVGSGSKATHVMARVHDFAKRLKEKYGEVSPEVLNKAHEHVQDIIEGDSFNKTFGTTKEGGNHFSPADAYVNHVTRKGGRVIDANTIKAGTDFVTKNAGMRGLQWGNSVSDDERQHHLTKTSEALADLADATGLPDSATSLNGALGLAIGARGKGKAMAHYEPGTKVINITRKKGAGTVAHEWGHALDHFIAGGGLVKKGDRQHGDYLSNDPRDHGGDPVKEAMKSVRAAIKSSGFEDRARDVFYQMKKNKQIPKTQSWEDYWGSHHEKFARAFEKHVKHKLESDGRENTYLSGIADHGLWPTAAESAHMAPHFEKLLGAVKAKHFAE